VELGPTAVAGLLVVAIVLAIAAIVLGIIAITGQRRVRDAYRTFSRGSEEDVLTLIQRHIEEVHGLRVDVAELDRRADHLRDLIASGLSRVSTIRYDAFEDMGGRLSFSTALLDERGDGVVITSINGRTETRTYGKSVSGGRSRHNLSTEEEQAIEQAFSLDGRTGRSANGVEVRRPAGTA
jgi:hypothetical protein